MDRQSNGTGRGDPARESDSGTRSLVEEDRGSAWWMVFGIMACLVSLFTFGKLTLVSVSVLFRLLAACCFLGLLVPYRWSGLRFRYERLEWVLLLVLGIGPTLFTLILAINFYFAGRSNCEDRTVEQVVYTGFIWRVETQDGSDAEFPAAREHYFDPGAERSNTYRMCTASGALGMEVVISREVL